MEHLRQRIEAVASDRQSGATPILALALAVQQDATATGQPIVPVARALCRAQPNMASVWNAAAAAVAARFEPIHGHVELVHHQIGMRKIRSQVLAVSSGKLQDYAIDI
jgi:hypothetical protein